MSGGIGNVRSTRALENMNELALFIGVGGGALGASLHSRRIVCGVERDFYAASVLVQRQLDGLLPSFPIWDDVRTFDGRPWRGVVDLVSGGFPCQVNSSASRGRPVAEDLWAQFLRIVADVAPGAITAENVTRKAIDAAADDLESLGYHVRCTTLSAKDMGADHVRERFWLYAYTDLHRELFRTFYAEVAERSRVRPCVWEAHPHEPRMADGLANRLDRLRASGNGQIPCVEAAAFAALAAELYK